jgi:thiol-disulfide isomerase/thioredoxin
MSSELFVGNGVAVAPLVVCLCAGWCTTCEAFRPALAELARRHPEAHFAWIDIEDQADALEAIPGGAPDIENFPTLLVSSPDGGGFFGTLLPQTALVERLLQQAQQGRLPRLSLPGLVPVVAALARLPACAL